MKRPAWKTTDGYYLIQVGAESTHYRTGWAEAKLMDAAFSYNLINPVNQEVLQSFHGSIVKGKNFSYNSDSTITKYIVKLDKLLKYIFYYHEESMYDGPIVGKSTPKVIYSKLVSLNLVL